MSTVDVLSGKLSVDVTGKAVHFRGISGGFTPITGNTPGFRHTRGASENSPRLSIGSSPSPSPKMSPITGSSTGLFSKALSILRKEKSAAYSDSSPHSEKKTSPVTPAMPTLAESADIDEQLEIALDNDRENSPIQPTMSTIEEFTERTYRSEKIPNYVD